MCDVGIVVGKLQLEECLNLQTIFVDKATASKLTKGELVMSVFLHPSPVFFPEGRV